MNQSSASVNAPYATLRRALSVPSAIVHKNNTRAIPSRILCILNSDWLRHSRSVRGVFESPIILMDLLCIITTVMQKR